MRIAIVGAGGQVGSEVTLRLSGEVGMQLVPITRDRQSSAFLRYNGIPVAHGSLDDGAFARAAFDKCDIIANFALAGGVPAVAHLENERLVQNIFDAAPVGSTLVFFSSLSVGGATQTDGTRQRDSYSDLKRAHENQVLRLSRKYSRKAVIFRLGHVIGDFQGLTGQCASEVEAGAVAIADPEGVSNTVHTVAICDAISQAARSSKVGGVIFDLVNTPQWTWREVYRHVSGGREPEFNVVNSEKSTTRRNLLSGLSSQLRPKLMRLLGWLPERFNRKIQAQYFVRRAAGEISALNVMPEISNTASLWQGLNPNCHPDASNTAALIEEGHWALPSNAIARWPDDIPLSCNEGC